MQYTPQIVEELNILTRFTLDTNLAGIKVHSDASPEAIQATLRLFEKGLITQADGGFLTALGRTATEHAKDLIRIMDVGSA